MEPLIKSILDDDLYKFSMMAAYAQLYGKAEAKFIFINRGKTSFDPGFSNLVQEQINYLANLKLTKEEKQFLKEKCPYFSPVFLDLLSGFRYNPSEVCVYQTGGALHVEVEGSLYRATMWEVKLMSIISELYFKTTIKPQMIEPNIIDTTEIKNKTKTKLNKISKSGAILADFGTRRRYSYKVHNNVIEALKETNNKNFVGTSNVHLALKHNLTPIGTQAHEWFMFHAAKYGYSRANAISLGRWVDVYNGDLGIALSDTFTTSDFFKAFDSLHAKLWDGVRQDSGDPYAFGDKLIDHYKSLNIDPKNKTIVFSDGLDDETASKLAKYFKGRIKTPAMGIGTFLTNDVGAKPLNMVIKMAAARPGIKERWIPTVKLSDNPGKHTGSENEIRLCKQTLNII